MIVDTQYKGVGNAFSLYQDEMHWEYKDCGEGIIFLFCSTLSIGIRVGL